MCFWVSNYPRTEMEKQDRREDTFFGFLELFEIALNWDDAWRLAGTLNHVGL